MIENNRFQNRSQVVLTEQQKRQHPKVIDDQSINNKLRNLLEERRKI